MEGASTHPNLQIESLQMEVQNLRKSKTDVERDFRTTKTQCQTKLDQVSCLMAGAPLVPYSY